MTIETGTLLGVITIQIGVIIWLAKLAWWMSATETKLNVVWGFLMNRAIGEAVQKNIATFNSPVIISEEAKRWMSGIADQLRDFYVRLGRRMTEWELALEIERVYGDRILKEVCIPNNLSQGACLLIAVEVSKEMSQNNAAK